jgi:phosphatidylinositol 4-kinase
MYSLLNYIAATSEIENSSNLPRSDDTLYDLNNHTTLESGLRSLSEDEKKVVGISTISVVTRLALEFHMEEVSDLVCHDMSWLIVVVH